jgi:hypothetical protein
MRLLCIIGLFGIVSCGSAVSPREIGLATTVQLSRPAFRAGDSIEVTTTIVNRGAEPQNVNTDSCPFAFIVTNASGDEVGPDTAVRDCFPFARLRALAPGEQLVFTNYWAGSALRHNGALAVVLPGQYFVRRRVTGVVITSNDSVGVRVVE